MYPEELVRPMRAELSEAGFEELYSAGAVENAIGKLDERTHRAFGENPKTR